MSSGLSHVVLTISLAYQLLQDLERHMTLLFFRYIWRKNFECNFMKLIMINETRYLTNPLTFESPYTAFLNILLMCGNVIKCLGYMARLIDQRTYWVWGQIYGSHRTFFFLHKTILCFLVKMLRVDYNFYFSKVAECHILRDRGSTIPNGRSCQSCKNDNQGRF